MTSQIPRPDECLFCGVQLDDGNRTSEHVFPRWMQRRYGLSNLQLVLLNGAEIRYSRLLVPACDDCNNVHASQLEQRILEGLASPQDVWIWMLKLQLGAMYFESGTPWDKDQRKPGSRQPIVDGSELDLDFLHALFDTLKRPDPQFAPDPLGSVFEFPTDPDRFYYSDRLYSHPASTHEHSYLASCICVLGRCWIALFDDAGNIARNVDMEQMRAMVQAGRDPVRFLPELMYQRARFDYMPKTLVIGPRDGPAAGVAFVPPMGKVPHLDHDEEILDMFRVAVLGDDAPE
jgi:hypothetical protein